MNDLGRTQESTAIGIVNLPASRWQDYKELRLRALRDEPQAFGTSLAEATEYPEEKWKERLQAVVDGVSWTLFAEKDGQLIGMLGAYQKDSDKKEKVANVFGVFVASEARGKKVASKLMKELLRQLKLAGITTARLMVNKDQQAAVALYKKFGFTVTGKENVVLGDGKEHTELVMERGL